MVEKRQRDEGVLQRHGDEHREKWQAKKTEPAEAVERAEQKEASSISTTWSFTNQLLAKKEATRERKLAKGREYAQNKRDAALKA